ncbi:uncharacterized protein LOC144687853 isoform X2 [Cetorhinus maximus]
MSTYVLTYKTCRNLTTSFKTTDNSERQMQLKNRIKATASRRRQPITTLRGPANLLILTRNEQDALELERHRAPRSTGHREAGVSDEVVFYWLCIYPKRS